jgi:ribosome-associated protein
MNNTMTPLEIAQTAARALDDKKGKDIKVLHTTDLTVVADYFVICTASSTTQVKTLCDEVDKVLSQAGEPPIHREGFRSGGWVLLDFGCCIVHIFLPETREFYNLERLWSDADEVKLSSL